MLDRLVSPSTVFVDLGAWIGALSLYAAGRGARAFAVEADPRALDQLRRNLAANPDLACRITVVSRAVSASANPVRLGARRKPGDSMSSALLSEAVETWTAPAITPPELAVMIGDARDVVVKIDIEGGEYALLPAIAPLLNAERCAVLVAFHPDILRQAGIEPIEVTRSALGPFAAWAARPLARDENGSLDPAQPIRGEWLFEKETDAPNGRGGDDRPVSPRRGGDARPGGA